VLVANVIFASCHRCGSSNFKVARRFFENMWAAADYMGETFS